jgi:hypothetical protein
MNDFESFVIRSSSPPPPLESYVIVLVVVKFNPTCKMRPNCGYTSLKLDDAIELLIFNKMYTFFFFLMNKDFNVVTLKLFI